MTGVAPVTRAAGSAGRTQTEATQGSEPIGCEPRGRLHRAKRGASGLSRWPLRRPSRNEKVAGGPYQVVHWTNGRAPRRRRQSVPTAEASAASRCVPLPHVASGCQRQSAVGCDAQSNRSGFAGCFVPLPYGRQLEDAPRDLRSSWRGGD